MIEGDGSPRLAARAALILAALLALGLSRPAAAQETPASVPSLLVQPTDDFSRPEPHEEAQGGDTTSYKTPNKEAFSRSAANLSFEKELDFKVGNGIFKKVWVSSPSSTTASDGLGPLYNARACQRCHLKDGRGHPPVANAPDDDAISMFLRLSIPPRDEAERALLASGRQAFIPEPTYGEQLQDFAIQGHLAEGLMRIDYQAVEVALAGGDYADLRAPTYSVDKPAFGPLHPDTMISPRVTPQMIGLGLVEMIPEDDILAGADPDDSDGDGISGRPNRGWSEEAGKALLGRFGWKAGKTSLRDQIVSAFHGDMGISTTLFPQGYGDCTAAESACRGAPDGATDAQDGVEASDEMVDLVLFYSRHLALPARRDAGDTQVLEGKRLFYETGCIACHRPKFMTGQDPARPALSGQLIWPYSDFLLHDLGEGLADNRPEGQADGQEWRTPPLWGIGLTERVNGHTQFLHDGRARNLLEAILWHGGEAEAQRDAVAAMSPDERAALLRFLNSL